MGYCYLLIPSQFVSRYNNDKKENIVCKFGKTDEYHPENRMCVYSKKCKVLVVFIVCNASFVEQEIKKTFKIFFKRRSDLGNEYFEGNIFKMKTEFINACIKYQEYMDEYTVLYKCDKFQSPKENEIIKIVDENENDEYYDECCNKFYSEYILKEPTDAISWTELLIRYREWYEQNFEDETNQNQKKIKKSFCQIFKKDTTNNKNANGECVYGWKGFVFKEIENNDG
jgi:hypothetical protein